MAATSSHLLQCRTAQRSVSLPYRAGLRIPRVLYVVMCDRNGFLAVCDAANMGALKTIAMDRCTSWVVSVSFTEQWLLASSHDGSLQAMEVVEKHDIKTRQHFAADGCGSALTDVWLTCSVHWGSGAIGQDAVIGLCTPGPMLSLNAI